MAQPIWTESEAYTRASELLMLFDRDPDVLSPNEQAFAMGIRIFERTGREVLARLTEQVAMQIERTAEGHYARDIRGTLALTNWRGVAQALRESHQPAFVD